MTISLQEAEAALYEKEGLEHSFCGSMVTEVKNMAELSDESAEEDSVHVQQVSLAELNEIECDSSSETSEMEDYSGIHDDQKLMSHCLPPYDWQRPVLFFAWRGEGKKCLVWGNFNGWYSILMQGLKLNNYTLINKTSHLSDSLSRIH
jgi:hypothetical protein